MELFVQNDTANGELLSHEGAPLVQVSERSRPAYQHRHVTAHGEEIRRGGFGSPSNVAETRVALKRGKAQTQISFLDAFS